MGCETFQEKFSELIDGRLNKSEQEGLERHLKECPACRAELAALEGAVRAVRALPEQPAPPDFLFRLRERIDRESVPAWKKAVSFIDRNLERLPLKPLAAAAAAVLALTVAINYADLGGHDKGIAGAIMPDKDAHPVVLESSTDPVPVEFASTRGGTHTPMYIDTPNEFVMSILKSDPQFSGYRILPHPRGMGALVDTGTYLYEVVMDPSEFPMIQSYIEYQGGEMPTTLREAASLYPIYVRTLPSPTKPIE